MDRNQVIGFSLLAALLVAYIVFNNQSQKQYKETLKQDSAALAHNERVADSAAFSQPAAQLAADTLSDSLRQALPPAFNGTAETVKLENPKLALEFTTKGAYPTSAQIKDFKTYHGEPLYLFRGAGNGLSMVLPVNNGATATGDLYYTHSITKAENGDQTILFTSDLGNGQNVQITYTLPADDYMVRTNIRLSGMSAATLPLTWQMQGLHTERSITDERNNSQIYYRFKNEDHDYYTIGEEERKTLEENTHWVGFRKHYFSAALINDNGFGRTDIVATSKINDTNLVARSKVTFNIPAEAGPNQDVKLRWYMGPNHYRTLRNYKIDLDDMVPLGYGIFAFVKYINKFIIIPVFDFLSGFIGNFGIIIMLLTIFIRLILSFFTYKSYLSAAKMRVLKPEIDELRAKYSDDQQRFGMEQMKLFRTAGVNPLGGCLPTLLQLPILFAMYYFFPTSIELRQESFLWANDLSTYDSIANLPFNIPFYGSHVSLFTLLMTASSLFLALYNRNMTAQDPNNPMMKWLPFIFPIMLMGVFNSMAAALTFYYFFSNMISIGQQYVIQKFIINEDKIHAQIQENRNKPATPSKWQQRIEEMQKAQQERMKQQPRTKK